MYSIAVLGGDGWPVIRSLLLASRRDGPAAFMTTYEEEAAREDGYWFKVAATETWAAAFDPGQRPVGILAAVRHPEVGPNGRYLESLWVDPAHRRRGLAMSLVRMVLQQLRDDGVEVAWLWVLSGNDPARRLYERLGFRSTGRLQPVGTTGRYEERMRRDID